MARLSLLPPAKFIPFLLIVVVIAAYQSSRHWGDIIALVIAGTIGCVMKQLSWPRVPFLIGFILAVPAERYLVVATQRYGAAWLTRPLVLVIGTLIIGIVVWQVVSEIKAAQQKRQRQKVDNGQPAPVHN
jgi:TctA family transporter